MIYKIIAIMIMIIFYTFYIVKLLLLNSKSIKTNQAGVGNKPKRVIMIERIMSIATIMTIIAQVCSILCVKNYIMAELRIVGIILGIISIIFFALATITMKNSWRVGIPEEKTYIKILRKKIKMNQSAIFTFQSAKIALWKNQQL